ncbi:tRNA1(Val) (adenine(37)-N6)-methyltransferase [Limimaricola pyoseonensis]|uniref:tRNA1(Val) A37 N6-methylase TrmN6 n=1 Tax=Limimaricola pyoseonensis TaxID=521013 RepID=A0A1G7K0G8_9RHOB|nr:methyltransferase [Limimaricola pyoseonensis]SDF30574.1 tRNA1(Val) A37 N6-methylase TrmN6 [Limimaricola pyoseonensis]
MTSTWADEALTRDAFLGGRVWLRQPRRGYRAGTDPVLLAAAVEAEPGQSVLDIGCGAGAALLCLGARVPGLALAGVELQPGYADLARRNAAENGLEAEIHAADLRALPATLKARRFDHVISNPPYFDRAHSRPGPVAAKETAFADGMPLPDWIDAMARRVAPLGRLTLIQRAERLPEIIAALHGRMGGIAVQPVVSRAGRIAERVIVSARQSGRGAFRLASPLVMHEGRQHLSDAEDFTPEAMKILRYGGKLRIAS